MKGFFGKAFLVICICALAPVALLAATDSQPRLITVSGDAEVKVAPDEVELKLGVETWNPSIEAARSQNDKIVSQVLALAPKYKIESKHVQTDYISIEPTYKPRSYNEGNVVVSGYFVRKNISFVLKDPSKFESLLRDSLDAGANYVHGIEFRTTNLRKYRDEARALAVKAAQEKAIDMAKVLGAKPGKPYSISENGIWWYSPYNSWWGRWSNGAMAQNAVQNYAGGQASPESSMALGQISVNARVSVSFDLE
jgi:uncharacterized protein